MIQLQIEFGQVWDKQSDCFRDDLEVKMLRPEGKLTSNTVDLPQVVLTPYVNCTAKASVMLCEGSDSSSHEVNTCDGNLFA